MLHRGGGGSLFPRNHTHTAVSAPGWVGIGDGSGWGQERLARRPVLADNPELPALAGLPAFGLGWLHSAARSTACRIWLNHQCALRAALWRDCDRLPWPVFLFASLSSSCSVREMVAVVIRVRSLLRPVLWNR